jgi:hypothetical protein
VIRGLDSGLDRRARPALDSRPVARGHRYAFDVLEQTGLTSGTVYPALERLEGLGLARSRWEDARMAHEVKASRPGATPRSPCGRLSFARASRSG